MSIIAKEVSDIVVHLHVHSDYSPMTGVSPIPTLLDAVRAQRGTAVALTDTNGLYGAIRFVEEARGAGLRPILGAELVTDHHRAVLLAKTPEGYANLCRVLSARHCESSFDFIRTVANHRTGLILL
ncbi:MAG TPA: PHP domain-containing protein, partial [Nitrospiraceae bacterium]|nr:PHP domain-containing protein [Nitrospiraceae bacterium]